MEIQVKAQGSKSGVALCHAFSFAGFRFVIFVFYEFNARRGIATHNCNSMVNDGNYTCPIPQKGTDDRATSSRPTTPFLAAQNLTLYQVDFIITYEHLFVKCFLILFRISHNARSLIFCVSFPIFPHDFRIRAVRIWLRTARCNYFILFLFGKQCFDCCD